MTFSGCTTGQVTPQNKVYPNDLPYENHNGYNHLYTANELFAFANPITLSSNKCKIVDNTNKPFDV